MNGRSKGLFLVPRAAIPEMGKPEPAASAEEQKQAIAGFAAELTAEYQPSGPTEAAMIQMMAAARWRVEQCAGLRAQAEQYLEWEKLLPLERYQAANQKSFRWALKTLEALQKSRPRPKLVTPKTVAEY